MNNSDPVALLPVAVPPPILPPPPILRRPGWATAIGTLSIIFASLGFLSQIGTVVLEWLQDGRTKLVLMSILPNSYLTYSHLAQLVGVDLSALLLVGGIQLLRRWPMARTLLLVYGWVGLAIAVPNTVVLALILAALSVPDAYRPAQASYVDVIVGGVIGLFLIAYPLFLVIWFARAKIKNQARGWANLPG